MIVPSVHLGLGLWIMVSPWLLGSSGNSLMLWSNTAVGLGLLIAALWEFFGHKDKAVSEIENKKVVSNSR
ncbi:MAG: SPW repeat protein [Patescibacteria group bacterium]